MLVRNETEQVRRRQFLQLKNRRQWVLMGLDLICLLTAILFLLILFPGYAATLTPYFVIAQIALLVACIFGCRVLGGIYQQVWRFAGKLSYLRLIVMDFSAFVLHALINRLLPLGYRIPLSHELSIVLLTLFGSIVLRFCYQYLYENAYRFCVEEKKISKVVRLVFNIDGDSVEQAAKKIRIAIVGAGRVGAMLAEELLSNPRASYEPVCFIDVDREKIGREILGVKVLPEGEATMQALTVHQVQEIVFVLPKQNPEERAVLYEKYKTMGFKIKVYDFPVTQSPETGKRQLREFDIEELLFRREVEFIDNQTREFYHNKVVLISGGGGSIGSELSRQICKMEPKQLILLDIYENSIYDVQQELRIVYGDSRDIRVEIASVRDVNQLDKVFSEYHPDIVLHAAAHKHVPLMEHNCSEAVKNNVFGTLNMVNISEKYGVKKFIMISTDKAVNPTNVMGATKRMCEMIVQSRVGGQTSFSATRFGNVLGSNGSVIPLFKRQIANGGPITITDKRIIRYFMTIPEASQLVLTSGVMAKSGELCVLNMGKPVKILDLAENMIKLSGLEPYRDIDIVETGLRPGEKLYEEILIKTEELEKTDNSMIYIERDKPLTRESIEQKLAILREALTTQDDEVIRQAMMRVVPTFHSPDEVNANAVHAREMKLVGQEKEVAV